MQVIPIPCLVDNYAYIINDNISKAVAVVDPSEASPVIDFLKKQNLKLDYILNTHHHYDHIGGNIELKKLYNAKVIGFAGDKNRIPGIDIALEDNVKWTFGKSSVKILHIPGHTLGHICFFFENEQIAFTGDTLFSLGCGRIFEGDHKQMLTSLNKIKKLPRDTKIYCGHEYTYKNAEFCMKYDDDKKKWYTSKPIINPSSHAAQAHHTGYLRIKFIVQSQHFLIIFFIFLLFSKSRSHDSSKRVSKISFLH